MATEAQKIEYVKALVEWAKDDARQVYIRVVAALGLAGVFVTRFKDLRTLSIGGTVALFLSLGALALAAFLYFLYVSKTHVARRNLAAYFLAQDPRPARTEVVRIFEEHGRLLWFANRLFGGALLPLTWVLVELVA